MSNCSVQSIIDAIIKNTKAISTEASLYKVVDESKLRAYIAEKLQEKTAKSVLERIDKLSKIKGVKPAKPASTVAAFPVNPNIKYGADDGGLPVDRLKAKEKKTFNFKDKSTGKAKRVYMWYIQNFSNPFKVKADSNKYSKPNSVGFFATTSDKEAAEKYYEWLTDENFEYPTHDIEGAKLDFEKLIPKLNKRREFILDNLKHIADGSIYSFNYKGTSSKGGYNHVQALVAAANKIHNTKEDKTQNSKFIVTGTPNKYNEKDLKKFSNITKLIAVSYAKGSSTYRYAKDNKGMLIDDTTEIHPDDIVGVSLNGKTRTYYAKAYKGAINLVDKAIAVGATIIADAKTDRSRPHNSQTEGALAEYLVSKGYTEDNGNGVWKKNKIQPSSTSEIATWLIKKVGNKIGQFTTMPQAVSLIDIVLYNKYGTPYNHGIHNTVGGKSEIQIIDKDGVLDLVSNMTTKKALKSSINSYNVYLLNTERKLKSSINKYKNAANSSSDETVKTMYNNYAAISEKQLQDVTGKQLKIKELLANINDGTIDIDELKSDVISTVNSIYTNEHRQGTVLHELGHAAFTWFIEENPKDFKVERLRDLFEQAKMSIDEGSIEGVNEYWRTDLHEFISELFAQPKLVERLGKVKTKGAKVSLVEAVKKVIDSILSVVLKSMDKDSIAVEVFHILHSLEVNKEDTYMPTDIESAINKFIEKYNDKGC